MFLRILGLVVLVLLSMPVLSLGAGMMSEPNDVQVVAGIATLLGLVVAWYYIGRNYLRYFKRQFSDETPVTTRGGQRA